MIARRNFLIGAALLPILDLPAGLALADEEGQRFDADMVRNMARALASKPYKAPDRTLPPELAQLSYDDYRNIRFNADQALWRGEGLLFETQLLHRGFIFHDRVDINIVAEGRSRTLAYDTRQFRFEHGVKPPDPKLDIGFSGFRLHGPLNRPDYFDEIAVFQGASYFRALAKGQVYGSSARGLSVKTGDPAGEEFPLFKAFWIERPQPEVNSIVVHALLDSPSAAAAHRFTIRPGDATVMSVEMALYPREDIQEVGIGSLTSMFLFGPNDGGFDDFRPAVHDAQGLAMVDGTGEQLWRPLANPQRLQISTFGGANVRGFGLMQRQRSFFDYQDLEARYEQRPSVWVEPIGDWGEGAVHLLEIPTQAEIHDNIVTFWRPKDALRKGSEYIYTYRLHWTWDMPPPPTLARAAQTRSGGNSERRLFIIDLVDGPAHDAAALGALKPSVTASAGQVADVVLQPNGEIGGARLSFAFAPQGADVAELRARLMKGDAAASETWLYRWTP